MFQEDARDQVSPSWHLKCLGAMVQCPLPCRVLHKRRPAMDVRVVPEVSPDTADHEEACSEVLWPSSAWQ